MSSVIAIGVVRYQVFQADAPRMLEAVFQGVDEGILLLDQEGRIRLHSPALSKLFQLQEDILGLPFSEVFAYEKVPTNIPGVKIVQCLLNGTRVPVLERRNPITVDKMFLGEAVLWTDAGETVKATVELQQTAHQFQKLAITDPLTQVYNRRYLEKRLEEALANFIRYGIPASLILVDLDDFKQINDTSGHSVGDLVLKEFAQMLQRHTRRGDLVFRYGGDEFCILLPNTPLNGAHRLAQRIISALNEGDTFLPKKIQASMGVAEVSSQGRSFKDWLERADAALYKAKRSGKGCVMDISS